MKWLEEMQRYSTSKTLFIIHGNIHDQLPYRAPQGSGGKHQSLPLNRFLYRVLKDAGYDYITLFDQVDSFRFFEKQDEINYKKLSKAKPDTAGHDVKGGQPQSSVADQGNRRSRPDQFQLAIQNVEEMFSNDKIRSVLIIDHATTLTGSPEHLSPQEREYFIRLMKLAKKAFCNGTNNLIIMNCQRVSDLPDWFYLNFQLAKPLLIDLPTQEERYNFFEKEHGGFFAEKSLTGVDLAAVLDAYVDLTHKMSNYELKILKDLSRAEKIPFHEPSALIERYKFGVKVSPWENFNRGTGRKRLHEGEKKLKERVKGQDAAVRAAMTIIKRAVLGLSGAQHSSKAHKPKGILFFAGPTGVGKTELAKAIAELIFSDENNCLRFDMSEYSQEHSDQRLFGAPPGYVGYDEGGQLTNAVKDNPFSVILFDEIEKAHPRIMEKFLQILEDGRMTDGKGETAYFSEALIIFTSNIGSVTEMNVGLGVVKRKTNVLPYAWQCKDCECVEIQEEPLTECPHCCGNTIAKIETPYPLLRNKILSSIEDYFKTELKRPELLNRFGNNFVVFDYIRPKITREIAEKIIGNITVEVDKKMNITLKITDSCMDFFVDESSKTTEMGGRGIGNMLETLLVNPLAEIVFEKETLKGKEIIVHGVRENNIEGFSFYDLDYTIKEN